MGDFFKKYKRDIQIIGAILAVQVVLLIIILVLFPVKERLYVHVTHDGEIIRTYKLYENTYDKIELDGQVNEIQIYEGMVLVTASNCQNQLCVKHSAISREGESIVCLPHKLVVQIDSVVE